MITPPVSQNAKHDNNNKQKVQPVPPLETPLNTGVQQKVVESAVSQLPKVTDQKPPVQTPSNESTSDKNSSSKSSTQDVRKDVPQKKADQSVTKKEVPQPSVQKASPAKEKSGTQTSLQPDKKGQSQPASQKEVQLFSPFVRTPKKKETASKNSVVQPGATAQKASSESSLTKIEDAPLFSEYKRKPKEASASSKSEQSKTEQSKTEQIKSEPKPEPVKPALAQSEQTKSEQVKPEQAKPELVKKEVPAVPRASTVSEVTSVVAGSVTQNSAGHPGALGRSAGSSGVVGQGSGMQGSVGQSQEVVPFVLEEGGVSDHDIVREIWRHYRKPPGFEEHEPFIFTFEIKQKKALSVGPRGTEPLIIYTALKDAVLKATFEQSNSP